MAAAPDPLACPSRSLGQTRISKILFLPWILNFKIYLFIYSEVLGGACNSTVGPEEILDALGKYKYYGFGGNEGWAPFLESCAPPC